MSAKTGSWPCNGLAFLLILCAAMANQPVEANAKTFQQQGARGSDCYRTSIDSPNPFLGNGGETILLADGTSWVEVSYQYLYLYEYYPSVTVCPSDGRMYLGRYVFEISPRSRSSLGGATPAPALRPTAASVVLYVRSGCDYFIVGDDTNYALLEWFGGSWPQEGETIRGDFESYGFRDLIIGGGQRRIRVWVEDYWLTQTQAITQYAAHCR